MVDVVQKVRAVARIPVLLNPLSHQTTLIAVHVQGATVSIARPKGEKAKEKRKIEIHGRRDQRGKFAVRGRRRRRRLVARDVRRHRARVPNAIARNPPALAKNVAIT